jgi:hypothetical protein
MLFFSKNWISCSACKCFELLWKFQVIAVNQDSTVFYYSVLLVCRAFRISCRFQNRFGVRGSTRHACLDMFDQFVRPNFAPVFLHFGLEHSVCFADIRLHEQSEQFILSITFVFSSGDGLSLGDANDNICGSVQIGVS